MNELASAPVKLTLPSVTDVEPVFLSVNVWAAEVDPFLVVAKERLLGDTVRVAADAPVPERATFCGELDALSVMAQVAVSVPEAVGLNSMFTVQLAPAATVPGQLVED